MPLTGWFVYKEENTSRNTRDASGKCPGNFRELSAQLDISVKIPGKVPRNVRGISGKFLGNVQEMSGKCSGTVPENSQNLYAKNLILVKSFWVNSNLLTSKFRFSHGLISKILV